MNYIYKNDYYVKIEEIKLKEFNILEFITLKYLNDDFMKNI